MQERYVGRAVISRARTTILWALVLPLLLFPAAPSYPETKVKLVPQQAMALWVSAEGTIAKEGTDVVVRISTVTVYNPGINPSAGYIKSFAVSLGDKANKSTIGNSAEFPVDTIVDINKERTWANLEFRIPVGGHNEDFLLWLLANTSPRSNVPARALLISASAFQCPDVITVTAANGQQQRFDVRAYVQGKGSQAAALQELRSRRQSNSAMQATYDELIRAVSCSR